MKKKFLTLQDPCHQLQVLKIRNIRLLLSVLQSETVFWIGSPFLVITRL